ncbi:hypothetical protein C8Q72DRAFT_18031 [Fomitopsis betulina]|nr:hypothetical protein C8Q72DRAFT_18031 [Fomitopsis betulina]
MKSAQTGAGRQSDVLSIAWVENAIGRRPKLITDIMRDVGQALLLFGNRILRIAPLYSLTSFEAQEFSVYGPRGLGRCRPTAESLKKSRQVGNANEEGRWSRCDPSSVYVPRSIQVEYHLCYQVRDYTRLCAVNRRSCCGTKDLRVASLAALFRRRLMSTPEQLSSVWAVLGIIGYSLRIRTRQSYTDATPQTDCNEISVGMGIGPG